MNIFKKQLTFGEKYELKFAELTKQNFIQSKKLADWDLEIFYNDKIIKYEVKTDKLVEKTGNFVIEFLSNNKLSGINKSNVDYWVFNEIHNYNNNDNYDYNFSSYVIPLKTLKKILKTKPIKIRNACENGKNKIFLLKKKYLLPYKVDFNKPNFFITQEINEEIKEYSLDELELMFNNI